MNPHGWNADQVWLFRMFTEMLYRAHQRARRRERRQKQRTEATARGKKRAPRR
jgi:GAF domain-containing protein